MNIPTIFESLKSQVLNGEMSVKDAAVELHRAGHFNWIPDFFETCSILGIKTKCLLVRKYAAKIDSLVEIMGEIGVSDAVDAANIEFEDTANAEEVAGYYLTTYGIEAYNTWSLNTEHLRWRHLMSAQDLEVEKILSGFATLQS